MSLDFKILIGNSARLVLIHFVCDNRVFRLMQQKLYTNIWQSFHNGIEIVNLVNQILIA